MSDVTFRAAKISLWGFAVSVTSRTLLDIETLFRWVRRVSWLGCAYLLLQVAGWHSARVLFPSVFPNPIVPPMQLSYYDFDGLRMHYETFFYRPASFFGEPAYFSYYSFVTLVVVLFLRPPRKLMDLALPVVLTVCVVLSTSTTGLYLILLIWAVWLLRAHRYSTLAGKVRGQLAIFGPLAIAVMLLLSPRGLNDLSTIQAVAEKPILTWHTSVRLGGSYSLAGELDGAQRVVGVGLGNEDIYFGLGTTFYNDLTLILLSTGALGLLAFVVYGATLVLGSRGGPRLLAALYLTICLVEQHLYSAESFLILAVVLYARSSSHGDSLLSESDGTLWAHHRPRRRTPL